MLMPACNKLDFPFTSLQKTDQKSGSPLPPDKKTQTPNSLFSLSVDFAQAVTPGLCLRCPSIAGNSMATRRLPRTGIEPQPLVLGFRNTRAFLNYSHVSQHQNPGNREGKGQSKTTRLFHFLHGSGQTIVVPGLTMTHAWGLLKLDFGPLLLGFSGEAKSTPTI